MPTPLPGPYVPDYGRTIDAYRSGREDFLQRQKQSLLQEAGGLAAAGNMTGARNKLYSGGEFGEARGVSADMRADAAEKRAIQSHAQGLDDAKLAKALKSQELLGNMGQAIMKHANPAQALEQVKARLKAAGLNADSVTLDQLPVLMQQNVSVQQAFQNELEERRLRNQEAEALRVQSNVDRSFTREAMESDRAYQAGRDDSAFNRMHQNRTFDAAREESRFTPIPPKVSRMFDRQKQSVMNLPGEAGGPDPETQIELGKYEQGLRKEWSSLTADNRATNDSISRMRLAAKDGSGAADVALVYSYMKMLDPNAAVMEGDYAKASDTAGIPSQIVALYNKALTGQFLTPDQRQQFLRMGEAVAKDRNARYQKTRSQFQNAVKAGGADPSRVMLDEGEGDAPPLPGANNGAQPPQEAIQLLRQNPTPEYRASFDKWFGDGASKRILGN